LLRVACRIGGQEWVSEDERGASTPSTPTPDRSTAGLSMPRAPWRPPAPGVGCPWPPAGSRSP